MSDPDQIREEIERTRAELSDDVNALTEKVTPSRIVQRRVDSTKDRFSSLRERVMGGGSDTTSGPTDRVRDVRDRVMGSASDTAGSAGDTVRGMTDRVSSAASNVADSVSSAPQTVRQQAQGNPLAAGLIAFGVGWLVSSLLPASQVEQQAAVQVKDKATDTVQPLVQQAGKDIAQNLKEPAQQAVDQVKSTASDAADTVKDHATSAASDVKEQATSAASDVKDHATSAAGDVKNQAQQARNQ
jgi:Protein of unknown function (DUF3618)